MRIGPLSRDDRPEVIAILRRTSVFRDEEIDVALELFDDAHPAAGGAPGDDYTFIGAFDERSQLAGFACYGQTSDTDRMYDLYWLAVDPLLHRSGTGSLLVSAVEERLRQRRGRMVVAETSSRPDYTPTRSFYEHNGYVEAGRARDFYAPGDDRVIYTKRIESDRSKVDRESHAHE